MLFRNGCAFHSCGCNGPGPRPARLRDVAAFLAERRSRSEGERLLLAISRNAGVRKSQRRRLPSAHVAGEHPLAADAERLRRPTPAAAVAASLLRRRRAGARRRPAKSP